MRARLRWLRAVTVGRLRLRAIARVARWEATRNAAGVDRRTVVAVVIGVLLVVALAPAVSGVALDRGLYRVGVAPDNQLYGPANANTAFAVRTPSHEAFVDGELEILVRERQILYRDTAKGRAAIVALREAVETYNDRRLVDEPNQSAAFPVYPVELRYEDRAGVRDVVAPGDEGTGGTGETDDGSAGVSDGNGGDGGDGSRSGDASNGGSLRGGVGDLFDTGSATGAPSELAPPFPFQSLILAFLFVVPLNFVIQAYGSSVLSERVGRRGELLLVAPVTRGEIIAGKTLPYLLAAVGASVLVALAVGGGLLSVVAVVPLALLFLAATFLAAMFARSFTELTFLTVAVSVFLTSYAFVPAVFTDIAGIALISPLTLVVRDLSGAGVDPGGIAFAMLPATLAALVLFTLGAGVYREEDMFTQRAVHLKALDALAGRIRRPRSLVVVTGMLVPFVFVAELLAVATLFAIPGRVSILVLLVVVAVVEELAKALPVVAGYAHDRFPTGLHGAVVAGSASGLGFFLGEKLTLVVQLVGLPELRAGSVAFGAAAALSGGPLVVLALLLAPLALHVVTVVLSSIGASRGRNPWLVALTGAVGLHVLYNLVVVSSLG